jgi:hypothetical protein
MGRSAERKHWLRVADLFRNVVRQRLPADEKTGAPPLWSDLPDDIADSILQDAEALADQEGVDS